MELTNIDFINFPSRPLQYKGKNLRVVPMFLIGGANRGTNFVKNIRFTPEPAQRVDFSCLTYTGTSESPWGCGWLDSNTTESIRDTDGSLSGVANSVLVPDNAFNMASSCVRFSPGVLRCGYKAGLFFFLNSRNGVSEVEHTNFVVRRNDGKWSYNMSGATQTLMKSLYNNKFGVIADGRNSYEVYFLPGPNQTVWTRPDEFRIQFQSEGNIGDVSPVVILKNIGTNCRATDFFMVAAKSLTELQAASRDMYFSVGRDLYLKQKTYVQYFMDPQEPSKPISSVIRTVSSLPAITCD
ncbi:MAG: hypothetical protein AB7O96_19790 [Pseudobdellovibrionaceae bacterium]